MPASFRCLARLAGLPEQRMGHLAGYWGVCDAIGLRPRDPVDLIGPATSDDGDGGDGGEIAQLSL